MVGGAEEMAGSHLALGVAARPHRLGLLIPVQVDGWDWRRTFEVAIAAQTRIWGGQSNLLFPLSEDFTNKEAFWRIAETFDPDSFVVYAPSWQDISEISPAEYRLQHQRLREKMQGDSFGEESIGNFLTELDAEAAIDIEPAKEQLREIRDRLAPFHYVDEDLWRFDSFHGGSAGHWPFADVTQFKQLPKRVASRALGDDSTTDLLLTTHIGRVAPALASLLDERGVTVEQLAPPHLESVVRDRWRTQETVHPWDLSLLGAATYLRGTALSYPGTIVVGDDPWDFALYYALKRMTPNAWWLPSDLEADSRYLDTVRRAVEYDSPGHKKVLVVSISAPQRCAEVASRLQDGARKPICEAGDWRDSLPEHPQRLYSRDDEGLIRRVPAEGGAVIEVNTPQPAHVETENPAELRWLTEIRSPDWAAIRHPAVTPAVLGSPETDSERSRAGRDGVVYFSTRAFIHLKASLKSVVVHPELRAVPLLGQLRSVLEPQGWTIELSDKGVYARESARLMGGFSALCEALRDPAFRNLTETFRSPAGTAAPGRYLRSDSRRYLRWGDLGSAMGLANPNERIDRLLEQGVLSRGLILKCGVCRAQEWHRLGQVSEIFYCDRCSSEQLLQREAWGPGPEPDMSYRLAEVVYQLLEHNGELPLLAVYDRFPKPELPLTQAFELTFVKGDIEQELDIACAFGSRLVIGEATVDGHLDAKRFEFLRRLADATGAREVLLATSKARWSDGTETRASAAFPGNWPEVQLQAGINTSPSETGGPATESDARQ